MDLTRPRWALASGLGLLVAGAACTAFMLAAPEPLGFDVAWREAMLAIRNDALTTLAHALSLAGGPGSLVIMIALIVWWLATGRRWGALFLLVTAVVTTAVAQGVKHLVLRERPADPLVTVDIGSFPSGHMVTTAAFCLVVVAVMAPTRLRAGLIATALITALMIWDRTYVSAHWFSDTIGGALLGGGTTLLLWWAFAPLLEKDRLGRLAKSEAKTLT